MEELKKNELINLIRKELVFIISETNGISLNNTLDLLEYSSQIKSNDKIKNKIEEFRTLLIAFNHVGGQNNIQKLLDHEVGQAFFQFFKNFPLCYHEEHIHLTGSLNSQFLFPRISKIIHGPQGKNILKKIKEVYSLNEVKIETEKDLENLITLKDHEGFLEYLNILFIPKLILSSRQDHFDSAYHMAQELHGKYNIGHLRLKFTFSRATTIELEKIPGLESLSEEEAVLGLYQGLETYKKEHPDFDYVLSPCFRKESAFYDTRFKNKKDHFLAQVDDLLKLCQNYPGLKEKMTEVDTVGDESELFRKAHFLDMKTGLRRLQYNGFRVRSHHGETWKSLRRGIQSVDNAMNIWHINTVEHGLGLGINPNYYFHRLFQRVQELNEKKMALRPGSIEYNEIEDMEWDDHSIKEKILKGISLNKEEQNKFIRAKYYTSREIEHYQHDVLNRMIQKNVSLISLPSSNIKLTNNFPDYKGHPFSWWEKKGVNLGIGTDNYVTLKTNPIQELLLVLFSDADNLKITKLLMVATKENRRPYLGHQLWAMRKKENL